MNDNGDILFFGLDYLSNFYPAPITIDGRTYPTTEHYYQAHKFVGKEKLFNEVASAPDAKTAKKLAREHEIHYCANWNKIREDVIYKACIAKFSQHSDLRHKLLSTGKRRLIENSPTDAYWGIGDGTGLNRMGEILMRIREELSAQD